MPTEKDATHYNMSHRRRGKAFIFNHMHFDPVQQLKARNGTDADRDNLRVCLRQLDFEVEVYNDLPVKEIDRVLENAALEDHSDADCVLVAGEERMSKLPPFSEILTDYPCSHVPRGAGDPLWKGRPLQTRSALESLLRRQVRSLQQEYLFIVLS